MNCVVTQENNICFIQNKLTCDEKMEEIKCMTAQSFAHKELTNKDGNLEDIKYRYKI